MPVELLARWGQSTLADKIGANYLAMRITFQYEQQSYEADLSAPLDISIPLQHGSRGVNCFYAPNVDISPIRADDFIGDTREGGVVNFMNVQFNPHGNGTHTECVGHISKERHSVNASLEKFHYLARVVSVFPKQIENGDLVILKESLIPLLSESMTEALIIRTLPNDKLKKQLNYSGTNPPYLHYEAINYLVDRGLQHLLVDLPSVDREMDEGKLLAHKAFWRYPSQTRHNATITELIFVPNKIKDGLYLLNIGLAAIELDASPSKPILYSLKPI